MIDIRSFRDIVRLFFIYQREFRRAALATIIVAILGAFLLPLRFESEARLLVKPGRENSTLPIEISDRQAFQSPVAQRDPILDDEKILTGRPVVNRVAKIYIDEMSRMPPPTSPWKQFKNSVKSVIGDVLDGVRSVLVSIGIVERQSPEEKLAQNFEKAFKVTHAAGSSVMEISLQWDDPVIAQKILESWIKVYQEERRRILSNPSLYAFYEEQANKSAKELDDYKAQFQALQLKFTTTDVKDKLDVLTQRIETLKKEIALARNDLAGFESGLASSQKILKNTPEEIVSERQEGLNPVQLDLKNKLNEMYVERTRLLRTYVPTAQPIQDINQSIAQLESQLSKFPGQAPLSRNYASNSIAVQLKQGVIDRTTRAQETRAIIESKTAQIDQLQQERMNVLQEEPKAAKLLRLIDAAEKNYMLYTQSLEKARIDRELDVNRISNIAVVEAATLNEARVFPKSLGILLAMLPAALCVGLLAVYLSYLVDQRIYDGGRVESKFHVPLWATVPEIKDPSMPTPVAVASILRIMNMLPLDQIRSQGLTLGLTSASVGEGVSFIAQELTQMLKQHQIEVLSHSESKPGPGQLKLIECSGLLQGDVALTHLNQADLIVLVIQAQRTTVMTAQEALSMLQLAFKKVDGIIVNRRRFEIPPKLIRRLLGQETILAQN